MLDSVVFWVVSVGVGGYLDYYVFVVVVGWGGGGVRAVAEAGVDGCYYSFSEAFVDWAAGVDWFCGGGSEFSGFLGF